MAQRELGPVNATVLLSGIVVGTVATGATDAFDAALPTATPLAFAAGWVLALVPWLTLLGRSAPVRANGSL